MLFSNIFKKAKIRQMHVLNRRETNIFLESLSARVIDAYKNEQVTNREQEHREDRKNRCVAIFTLGFAVLTTIGIGYQDYILNSSDGAAQRSATAAENAAKSAKTSADLSFEAERGRVDIGNVRFSSRDPNDIPTVNFNITNIGRTPSTLILIRMYIKKLKRNTPEAIPELPEFEWPFQSKFYYGTVINRDSQPISGSITAGSADGVTGQAAVWYFRGEIAYRDIFGNEYRKGFCFDVDGILCQEPGHGFGTGANAYNYERREKPGTERPNWPM